MRLSPAFDDPPPCGSTSFQEVCDRLGTKASRNYFQQSALRHGVLCSCSSWLKDTLHKKFFTQSLLPIADRSGSKSLAAHLTFERSIQKGSKPPIYLPRGGFVMASRDRLCSFVESWNDNPTMVTGVNFKTIGVYWETWHPESYYVHPYVDLDFGGVPCDTSFHDVYKFVEQAQHGVSRLLSERVSSGSAGDVAIFFNRREQGDDVHKLSFHLHWYELAVTSMAELSTLIQSVNRELPPKPFCSSTQPMMDPQPYSANSQLFRMPYCGKQGQFDARLLPIRVTRRGDKFGYEKIHDNVAQWLGKSCTITLFGNQYRLVSPIQGIQTPMPQNRSQLPQAGVVNSHEDTNRSSKQWLDFWKPVTLKVILSNWFQYRLSLMKSLQCSTLVPTPESFNKQPLLQSFERLVDYDASYRVSVGNDNFCEYDQGATRHHHSGSSNAVSYILDFAKGKIAQQCQKCRPDRLIWRTFMHCDLQFNILQGDESKEMSTPFVCIDKNLDPIPFFLRFFSDVIIYSNESNQVLVYDNDTGIWRGGTVGNRLLIQLVSKLNSYYKNYRYARNSAIRGEASNLWLSQNQTASDEEVTLAMEKLFDDCRKSNKTVGPLLKLTPQQQCTFIQTLKPSKHVTVETMEVHKHLVPLANKKCVNLFTWSLETILPEYFFTSHLNATLLDLRDEKISEFIEWQKLVCCGDLEYLEYKLLIMGLSLSMFNFDRSFYMPLGPIGRNGKSSEAFLFNQITMDCTPNRGYNLSREYLSKTAQDRKGANAPDTVLMECYGKVVVIADECRDTPLDGALIKSVVSGDRANARNLYESERINIPLSFTLWIIANKTPKIDYTDPALMSRLKILPYNALWVSDPASVKAKMKLPASMYVFKEDPYFKHHTLSTWGDAMATKCLHALYLHFKKQPRDPDNLDRPLEIKSFDVPKVVQDYTTAIIQKEHPVLAFIQRHLGKAAVCQQGAHLDDVFQQFRQFGSNENSYKIKHFALPGFIEALSKEHIEIDEGRQLIGWVIKHEVPVFGKPVEAGDYYEPPAKKQCV